MGFHPRQVWRSLHWATRLAVLAVLCAILWWQARYVWSISNPMYGWPMPFNNVWYEEWRKDWLVSILAVDAAVWIALAAAVGYTLEQRRRSPNRWQIGLHGLFVLQAVIAMVLALAYGEGCLRAHPNNHSMVPAYARLDVGGIGLWFDLGLFTDPLGNRPLVRLAIISSIGCCIYTAISLFSSTVRRVWGARPDPAQAVPCANPQRDPLLVRVVLLVLGITTLVLSCGTLFPPAIR
jgi:hypothetical protein